MALAALKNWHVLQADFISAYLAGNLKETIFMKQFPQLKEFFEQNPGTKDKFFYSDYSVIELKRPVYGLKQSGVCWQEKVRGIMSKYGYTPLISDNAIYYKRMYRGLTRRQLSTDRTRQMQTPSTYSDP
ncbi:hypothetical protein K3495_g6922 [Podosphaera aphanis]|nr:hypothetical protein K3495_g6922 [Podosphaera aphanis]